MTVRVHRRANTRFVVINLDLADDPQGLYDGMYCERGEMENRIKDQQLGLFSDRASSSGFHANQLRLLLSGLAFILLEGMRSMALDATDLAKASPQTIRLTLLKVGSVVVSNTSGAPADEPLEPRPGPVSAGSPKPSPRSRPETARALSPAR